MCPICYYHEIGVLLPEYMKALQNGTAAGNGAKNFLTDEASLYIFLYEALLDITTNYTHGWFSHCGYM